MECIQIGKKKIGKGQPAFIIAEAGINHNGQLHIAKSLVDSAVQCGVDAIKFQKRDLKTLYSKKIIDDNLQGEQGLQYMIPILQECELAESEFLEIKEYTENQGVIFLCTPWDLKSAKFLKKLDMPLFKVSSADLTNFELLEFLCTTGKPLILSTGMATLAEIDKTVNFIKAKQAQFILLHCNSSYPAPFHNINLKVMNTLKERYGVEVGYSGHELGISVSTAAVALGACVIERHITIDRTMPGPDHAASLEPVGFKKLVRDIRNIELALGSEQKWLTRGEVVNRETLGKSLYACSNIKKGTVIKKAMVAVKSPYKGISGQYLGELLGTKAKRDIKRDEPFTERDLIDKNIQSIEILPNKRIGFVARINDLLHIHHDGLSALEFHFTDRDIEEGKWKKVKNKFNQELVIHCPEYWRETLLDPCSLDTKIRKISLDVLKKTVKLAKSMKSCFKGSKGKSIKIVLHPGGISRYQPNDDKRKLYLLLEEALNMYKDKDIEILAENMPPLPWYYGGQWCHSFFMDADEIASFCQKTGNKICFDLSHAQLYCNKNDKDISRYIKKVKPYIRHIHLADAAGWDGEGLQIGEGDIDFAKVIPLLNDVDVINIIEIWQGHKFNGEGFRVGLERLNQYWNSCDTK